VLEQIEPGHPVAVAVAQVLGLSLGEFETARIVGDMFGPDALTRRRLGQKSFKSLVLTAYRRRCAITGDRIQPVLEAAHILPVEIGGEHRLDNGLLLRSDVHTLFDAGYLTVDTKHRLRVSHLIRERWDNGVEFYARERQPIALPERRADWPSQEFLEWHNDVRFLG
jgi:putative restriction endonuclease